MSTPLFDHRQRLNIALTELLASTVQIEALVRLGIEINPATYADFFERAAICLGQLAGMQEEITRIWQDQSEKGGQP